MQFRSLPRRIGLATIQLLRGRPLRIGEHWFFDWRRPALLRFRRAGRNVILSPGLRVNAAQRITIGDSVFIGEQCLLNGIGGLVIGTGVFLAPRVNIVTFNHHYDTGRTIPFDEKNIPAPVEIGDYVWVGAGVNVVPGAKIGEGAIIGMASVVTNEIPPLSIAVGNPARIIGRRNAEHYKELKRLGRVRIPHEKHNA